MWCIVDAMYQSVYIRRPFMRKTKFKFYHNISLNQGLMWSDRDQTQILPVASSIEALAISERGVPHV
jgi:hypothetical protein